MENQLPISESILSPTETIQESTGLNTPDVVPEAPIQVSTELPSFLDNLPQELKDIPALRKFKDVDSLAKSYINAEKLLGKKLQDMSPEELKSIYGKMNSVPNDHTGYDLKGVEYLDDNSREFIQKTAFDLKLTPDQAKQFATTIANMDNEAMKVRTERIEQDRQDAEIELKKVWGSQLEYKAKLARDAVETFGGPELAESIEKLGLGNNVQLIKAFAKVGENLLESGLVGETGLGQFGMTPEQARDKIEQIKRSPDLMRAYLSEFDPNHKSVVKEMNELWEIINSGSSNPTITL